MRKFVAMLLACVMVLGTVSALAAEPVVVNATVITEGEDQLLFRHGKVGDTMYTKITPPDGYIAITQDASVSTLHVSFVPEDENNCTEYDLLIAYSELVDNATLGDMTDDEYKLMVEVLTADYNDPSVETITTEKGTKLIVVNENGGESDYAEIMTIYHGYFINVIVYDEDHQLDEAKIKTGMDILASLTFTTEE
ncbi:MAG: hypothetical protein Q4C54_03955 [Clostridia bacterium]|nr:hypothetical protein [Clostridia bacterium]